MNTDKHRFGRQKAEGKSKKGEAALFRFFYLCLSAFIGGLFVLSCPAEAQKFFPDDPLGKEPPPMRLEELRRRRVNDLYDLFQHTLGHPGQQHHEAGRQVRAGGTNTLDEVPDSVWFSNRIGIRSLTLDELVANPADMPPPADGTWEIIGAKTEGVTPGFVIRDSKKHEYFLKFDPLSHPEMATAADVIGAFLFRALGYHVPANHLVFFDRDRLRIADGARMPGSDGRDRSISSEDVYAALARVPRMPDGRIRAVASFRIPGKPVGESRFYGTRSDDPNDLVPHEHRRELRGLHVFSAWVNHNDARAINTFDTLVTDGDLQYVKHYLIDFGAILGSASTLENSAREGGEYFYQFQSALAQMVTLGLYVPRWARADYIRTEGVGRINWDAFEPDKWKPNYPNPAFRNRLPDDNFWASKKVMAFSEEQLRFIVRAARYSNRADEDLIVRFLVERRNRIGKTYFAQVLPLDNFRVAEGALAFDDLAHQHGFGPRRAYRMQWSSFDNQAETHAPLAGETSFTLPAAFAAAPAGSYFAAEIRSDDPNDKKKTLVYLRKEATGPRVVGIERFW